MATRKKTASSPKHRSRASKSTQKKIEKAPPLEELEPAPAEVAAAEDDRRNGRPSKYLEQYAGIARFLCLRKGGAATDEQLAECFNVSVATISNWKNDHPEFLEAIKEGKADPDDAVERSLFERATGYDHVDTKFFSHEGDIITEQYVKHVPPDVTAMIFYLCNRRPEAWRQRNISEVKVEESLEQILAAIPKVSG